MAPGLSRAIEEAMRQRGQAKSSSRVSDSFVLGQYEFDLVGLRQTNLQTRKVRQIRLGEGPPDEWQALEEAHGRLKMELAATAASLRCREQAVASLETSRLELARELQRVREELLLSRQREAEFEKSREDAAKELANARDLILRESLRSSIQLAVVKSTRWSTADELQRVREDLRLSTEKKAELEKTRAAELQEARDLASRESKALAARDRVTAFQATVLLLMQARRQDAARLACPAEPPTPGAGELTPASLLGSFRLHVTEAFLGTRASHRKDYKSLEFCPPPNYEIVGVSALINPDLAERFRLCVQRSRVGELPSRDNTYAARSVARPPAVMRLLGLSAEELAAAAPGGGGEGGIWDEDVLLGWHGASDGAVDEILACGFNPCCVGNGAGTMFGRGIYFAENSSKADLYAGPTERRFRRHEGAMTVILSAVYCGNMYAVTAPLQAQCSGWAKPPAPSEAQTKEAGIRR